MANSILFMSNDIFRSHKELFLLLVISSKEEVRPKGDFRHSVKQSIVSGIID